MVDSKRLIAFVFGIVGAVCSAVLAGYIFIAYILASAFAGGAFVPFLVPILSLIAVVVLNIIGASFCFKKPKIGGIMLSISLALIVGTSIYFFAQDEALFGLIIALMALPVIPALVLAFVANKNCWPQPLSTQPAQQQIKQAQTSSNTQTETQAPVINKQEETQTKTVLDKQEKINTQAKTLLKQEEMETEVETELKQEETPEATPKQAAKIKQKSEK